MIEMKATAKINGRNYNLLVTKTDENGIVISGCTCDEIGLDFVVDVASNGDIRLNRVNYDNVDNKLVEADFREIIQLTECIESHLASTQSVPNYQYKEVIDLSPYFDLLAQNSLVADQPDA